MLRGAPDLRTAGDAVGAFLQSEWRHSHYPKRKVLWGAPALKIRGDAVGVFLQSEW